MGTADFYAVVEGFEEIVDSLVVDTTELGAADEGELLWCVVVFAPAPRWPSRAAAAAGTPQRAVAATCAGLVRLPMRSLATRSTARSARFLQDPLRGGPSRQPGCVS